MIVWINGCHGAGKTSVARQLQKRLPGAWLFDPEQVGFMLKRVWPGAAAGDFKDEPLWRELTFTLLHKLQESRRGAAVLVPMTLANAQYHDEVVGRLRESGVTLHHFTLLASERELRRRLRWRLDRPSSRRWAQAQIRLCAPAFQNPRFAAHVETEDRSVADVAAEIAAGIGAA